MKNKIYSHQGKTKEQVHYSGMVGSVCIWLLLLFAVASLAQKC